MGGVAVPGMHQKEDALTTVMKGLQIARDVYGIKTAADQSERADDERHRAEGDRAEAKKEKAYIAQGGMSPLQKAAMEKTHDFSEQQTAGSTPVFIGTPEKNTPLFATVRKAKEPTPPGKRPLASAPTTRNGKKGELTQFSDGTETFIEAPPDAPKDPKEDKTASNAQDLRKEYNAHPVTKDTGALASAYKKVRGAAEVKAPTGASDMSLVYGMMKMLDPGTGVKEGEYASAEDTRSIDQNIVALYNKARTGEKLDDAQRGAFLAEADRLLSAQLELQDEQDQRYTALATQFKVPPETILDPTWAKLKGRAPISSGPKAPSSGTAQATPAGSSDAPPPGSVVRNKKTGQLSRIGPGGEIIPIDEESQMAIPPQAP